MNLRTRRTFEPGEHLKYSHSMNIRAIPYTLWLPPHLKLPPAYEKTSENIQNRPKTSENARKRSKRPKRPKTSDEVQVRDTRRLFLASRSRRGRGRGRSRVRRAICREPRLDKRSIRTAPTFEIGDHLLARYPSKVSFQTHPCNQSP